MVFLGKKNNKRGTLQDYFFIFSLAIIVVTTIIIGIVVYSSVRDTAIFTDNPTSVQIQESTDNLTATWDFFFITFFVLSALAAVISGFLSGTSPVFLWASILLSMILIIVGVAGNNYYDAVINHPQMSEAKDALPMTTFIFDNMGKFLAGFVFLMLIALFFPTQGGFGV